MDGLGWLIFAVQTHSSRACEGTGYLDGSSRCVSAWFAGIQAARWRKTHSETLPDGERRTQRRYLSEETLIISQR